MDIYVAHPKNFMFKIKIARRKKGAAYECYLPLEMLLELEYLGFKDCPAPGCEKTMEERTLKHLIDCYNQEGFIKSFDPADTFLEIIPLNVLALRDVISSLESWHGFLLYRNDQPVFVINSRDKWDFDLDTDEMGTSVIDTPYQYQHSQKGYRFHLIRARPYENEAYLSDFIYNGIEGNALAELRAAGAQYLATERGKEIAESVNNDFNWGDFVENIPDEILAEHGLRQLDYDGLDCIYVEQDEVFSFDF